MRQLIAANPDEATRIRRLREHGTRSITVTADAHGMAKLSGTLTDDEHLARCRQLRTHYHEHQAILAQRELHRPHRSSVTPISPSLAYDRR